MATNSELWSIAAEVLGSDDLNRRFRGWITNLIRVGRRKAMNASPDALFDADCQAILDDLNARTKSRYQLTDSVRHLVRGLMAKGYVVADFCHVNAAMVNLWAPKLEMAEYLRPSTLYRPSHFDEYLAAWYTQQRAAQELDAKRKASRAAASPVTPAAAAASDAEAATIAQLASVRWDSFATWSEFCRHTFEFPTADSLDRYLRTCPDRIQRMRGAPRMATLVLTGASPDWAEAEYRELIAAPGQPSHSEAADG